MPRRHEAAAVVEAVSGPAAFRPVDRVGAYLQQSVADRILRNVEHFATRRRHGTGELFTARIRGHTAHVVSILKERVG